MSPRHHSARETRDRGNWGNSVWKTHIGDHEIHPKYQKNVIPCCRSETVMSLLSSKNIEVPQRDTSQLVKNTARLRHQRTYRDVVIGRRQ